MQSKPTHNQAFTLLEIIIVVIIVGVLTSLALPRFFSIVEFSRAQEALSAIASVRGGLERYYVSKGNTYFGISTANIDTGDPLAGQPNAHFSIEVNDLAPATGTGYVIRANRNTVDGGDGISTIELHQMPTGITRLGTSVFAGIN